MTTINLVRHDTGPQIRVTLTDTTDDTAIDLTGATVNMHFRRLDTEIVLFSRSAYIGPDTAAAGLAVFHFLTGQLDLHAGDFEAEIEVVLASGMRQTVYEPLRFSLREDFA